MNLSRIKLLDIIFLQASILLLSFTGVIAKKASVVNLLSVEFIIYYSLELFIIGLYAILWQQIIKKFEISVAYANKGALIIWTFIWATLFFHETITVNNILGAILVIIGIAVVFKDVK